jgi:two-component system, NarL family, response regulator LiaR
MIRVMLADDHAMVRSGLQSFIGSAPDMEVVGAASNGREAVELAGELQPDVILMDLLMPVMGGIEAIRQLKAAGSTACIIALSTSEDAQHVSAALKAGADGYLVKDIEPAVLMASVRSAVSGGVPMSPSITASLLGRESHASSAASLNSSQTTALPALTPREADVLRLIRDGYTNRQIADALGIAEKTVKTHCSHLFQRIGVADRTQAAAWSRRFLADTPAAEIPQPAS